MDAQITGSEKEDGEVTVFFDDGYYAHSITEIGEEKEGEIERLDSMWGWILHMRKKSWWNDDLEKDFIKEVSKHL